MREHELVVHGEQRIHCEGCERRIANALGRVPGVREVRADHRTQAVHVVADDRLSGEAIREHLSRVGYEASPKEVSG